MTDKHFNLIVEDQLNFCKNLLITKGIEYNESEEKIDRLHNFKTAATLQNISTKKALAGMMAKHTVSIYDMCKNSESYSFEKWREKITDHINYLLLLMAVIIEEEIDQNLSEER